MVIPAPGTRQPSSTRCGSRLKDAVALAAFVVLIAYGNQQVLMNDSWLATAQGGEQAKMYTGADDSATRLLMNHLVKAQRTSHRVGTSGTFPIAHSVEEMPRSDSPSASTVTNRPFCVPWNVSSDDWWTHNVEWEIFHQDATHYCFQYIANATKRNLFRNIYQLQFQSDCSEVLTRRMWSSGLGADMKNVIDQLAEGRLWGKPVQMARMPWHYASPKPFNKATAVCPTQDMNCYFLPLSRCAPAEEPLPNDKVIDLSFPFVWDKAYFVQDLGQWYWEYVARSQTWFRKRVYDFVAKHTLQQPCTVVHVRRGDVIHHDEWSRRYHPITKYLRAAQELAPEKNSLHDNVLLLTDDHNAIGEAMTHHPKVNWMYMNRTRYRADEGGWEKHLPSQDAAFELAVIFATFQIVRQCSGIVRSTSNFGDLLYGQMLSENKQVWSVNVEDLIEGEKTFSGENSKSRDVSKEYTVNGQEGEVVDRSPRPQKAGRGRRGGQDRAMMMMGKKRA